MAPPNTIRLIEKAVITDAKFLSGFRHIWRPDRNATETLLWLVPKALEHLDKYGEAPGRNLEMILASDPSVSHELRDSLADLFADLSEEWEREGKPDYNSEYILEQAAAYLELEIYGTVQADLEAAWQARDVEAARQALEQAKPIEVARISAVNPIREPERIRKAFQSRSISLVNLGGALQEMVGNVIVRDSFVAFLAGEKVGKTWFLQAIEFGAMRAGSNVLCFQCGDLSEGQKIGRMAIQITGRNIKPKYNVPLLSPVIDCASNQDGSCSKAGSEGGIILDKESKPYLKLMSFQEAGEWYVPCQDTGCKDYRFASWWESVPACDDLSEEEAIEAWRRYDRATGDLFRLECFTNDTATVQQMDLAMTMLYEKTGWKADLVIDDYPDIHAPEPGSSKEFRHQENAKWKAQRRMSQKWNCAWVSVTQANQVGQDSRLLKPKHFGEDKRKKAHPTDAFGLNQDEHDKQKGIMRVNPLISRDDAYDIRDQVAVLQLLQRGRPNLSSHWLWRNGR